MNDIDRVAAKPEGITRSRLWLDISYDVLAMGLKLPPDLRIVQVKSNDETALISLLVEGQGDQYKYHWFPGRAIVHLAIYAPSDLPEKLLDF
jgi:hypothetical protein